MNREEARLILQSCRRGGQDAADPQFAEALALAKQDPELAAWFEQQQKFDALVGGSLRQVRAPARLKAEILALGKSPETPAESPVSVWWQGLFAWNSPVPWAVAVGGGGAARSRHFLEKTGKPRAVCGFFRANGPGGLE